MSQIRRIQHSEIDPHPIVSARIWCPACGHEPDLPCDPRCEKCGNYSWEVLPAMSGVESLAMQRLPFLDLTKAEKYDIRKSLRRRL